MALTFSSAHVTLAAPGRLNLNAAFASGATVTPTTDAFTLQIGTFTLSLPAGSFVAESNGVSWYCQFTGSTPGTAYIETASANNWTLSVSASQVDISKIANPGAPVSLTLGAQVGSTTSTP